MTTSPLGAITERCGTLLDSLIEVPFWKPVDIGDQIEHLLSKQVQRGALAVPWISFMRLPLPIVWLTAIIPETPRRDIRGTICTAQIRRRPRPPRNTIGGYADPSMGRTARHLDAKRPATFPQSVEVSGAA